MRRIGSASGWSIALALAVSAPALAEIAIAQNVDRSEVGLEDTFRLTVTVSDAPDSAQLQFPVGSDFEVLNKSERSEMSYQLGSGGAVVRRTHKYMLLMRPTRVGTITIPPS